MYYTRLQVICDSEFSEILQAEISEAGFDTFMEIENGFEAYAEQENFDKNILHEIQQRYSALTPLTFYQDKIEKKNWNEEWEKNYEPVIVDDRVIIRAGFHQPAKNYPHDIIITPKMSFGTGHHQTTHLMVKTQLEMDHANKVVMDAGCGTAVLAIMASKLGAKKIEAFDIDEWSVINGKENAEVNNCDNINIRQGKISDLTFEDDFDIILANINKNILLQEMHQYAAYLKPDGLLLLSGFYDQDIPDLLKSANQYTLMQVKSHEREKWVSLLLKKS
ncbi:MAG: 50S ribosomal protein L11 methyltransferase [Cyclobacteriaceae bacterium]|nr:50S ribosomal protein L11 methyltransferase [Cyclobacteriaceae bacterium]